MGDWETIIGFSNLNSHAEDHKNYECKHFNIKIFRISLDQQTTQYTHRRNHPATRKFLGLHQK